MTSSTYDKSKLPTDGDLAKALGEAYSLWTELIQRIQGLEPSIREEWTYSGKKYGWSLRLAHKKRPIVRMKAQEGYLSAGVLFGMKAYDVALVSDLPPQTIIALQNAVSFPEGHGIVMDVRNLGDVAAVVLLATIKLAH
jgi:hypothetical protein